MADFKHNTSDNKTRRLFLVAVIFALVAGVGTMLYLKVLENRLKKELTPPPQSMETVVVAVKDLPAGSRIGSSTMALRKVPREYVESDAISPSQYASVKGAVINKPLEKGKILCRDYIDINLPVDFSGTIREGYRAMTVEVSMLNGISGLIRPGNHIDLFSRLAARHDPNQSGASGEIVIPVLEEITVLATDRKSARPNIDEFHNIASEKPPQVYSTLTLEVSPKQAALVSMAKARGSLLAFLRNKKDTSRAQFSRVSTSDLFRNSAAMRNAAERAESKAGLKGIHRNAEGQLVTKDGVVITDPNVHLNSKGQLVTANGTVLSGHGFTIGRDGKIRDARGRLIDTATLTTTKDGTLADKNGPVGTATSYKKLKGGFLEDAQGHVLTPDGKILSGVTVDKAGNVHAPDGRIFKASEVRVDKDGQVHLVPSTGTGLQVSSDGSVHTADGKPAKAGDLVTVDKNGVVRTKNGKILKGWKIGKDGTVYNAQGKKMSAGDVLLAEKGMTAGKDGTVIGKDGKVYHARDLVTVDKNGVVRAKDGTVLEGVHLGKDGRLRDKNGKLLTAQDIVEQEAAAADNRDKLLAEKGMTAGKDGTVIDKDGKVYHARDLVTVDKNGVVRAKDGTVLEGVHMGKDGRLRDKNGKLLTAQDIVEQEAAAADNSNNLLAGVTASTPRAGFNPVVSSSGESSGEPYEVEYIIGGSSSNGTAKTFMIQVKDENEMGARNE